MAQVERQLASLALFGQTRAVRWQPSPTLISIVLLLVIVLPVPVGYVGGGADDWYYVQAARCASAHGWCIPATHWATRWPLIAPMGLVFHVFGEGKVQSMVVPLAYALAAVALFVRLVERHWRLRAALVAGITFVPTAVFGKALLEPNVDNVELAWLLAAANAASMAWTAHSRRWALAAGVCFGLALQTRMTGIAWVPIIAAALTFIPRPARRRAGPLVLVALAGIALPLTIEAVGYGLASGDPWLSPRLSSAHTQLLSSELAPGVDLTRSPILNPQFIAGWKRPMDIHVHWAIDGVLNLVANPQINLVLLAALALLWLNRATLTRRDPALWLTAAGALYVIALIYGLAIDPKPRMFIPVAAIAAGVVGRLAIRSWDAGERMVVVAFVIAIIGLGAWQTTKRYEMGIAGPVAAVWASEHPGDVALDEATRRFLTFEPAINRLPAYPDARASHLLMLTSSVCRARLTGLDGATGTWVVARARDFGPPHDPIMLCEFARAP